MTDISLPNEVTIRSIDELDAAFGSNGIVGSRTTRTKDDEEWFILREFWRATALDGPFLRPLSIHKASPPHPDFIVLSANRKKIVALIEITIASTEADQRERKKIEDGGQPRLLGNHGGRRAAANPEGPWADDVIAAIERKRLKSIFMSPHPNRHLIIYPTSNMSVSLLSSETERAAIDVLQSLITHNATSIAQIANGCCVHVLGKHYVCVDILGTMRLVSRQCQDTALVADDAQLFGQTMAER
jgi:hypothetical protein